MMWACDPHADEPARRAVCAGFPARRHQKGRGLKPAEENPGEFHAVSSIDLNHLTDPELSPKDSFSSTFGCALADLGDDEPRLCGITAAMKYGTGLNFFKHRHPGRFFDVGMAEEHAVTFAAAWPARGCCPWLLSIQHFSSVPTTRSSMMSI